VTKFYYNLILKLCRTFRYDKVYYIFEICGEYLDNIQKEIDN
jgi:hypothetical protein